MKLDRAAATNIVRMMIAVAHADGRLQDEERTVIEECIRSLGLAEEEAASLLKQIDTPPSGDIQAGELGSAEEREYFLRAALRVAWADGAYLQPEREKIAALARILGVASSRLGELEREAETRQES